MNRNKQNLKVDKKSACPNCLRPRQQCICERVNTVENSREVLILQYPREQYKLLNSARLTSMVLANSRVRVGLSWRNLDHAAGHAVKSEAWGVLYLGSGSEGEEAVRVLDRKKKPLGNTGALQGLIALDGSWKQAKSLWWRNPWLLKLNRIMLNPRKASLRKQTRREALSTAEAVACALTGLGEDSVVGESLLAQYETLIVQPNARDS